ncbi:MAG TPA: ATP-binding protein, partial [Rhodothermales bacterium]|nr:ATP-binding protein [Rhodothermales bacterium]
LTFYAAFYLLTTTPPYESLWSARFTALLYLAMQGSIAALVGFAYSFHARPFRREGRVALAVLWLTWAGMALWVGVGLATGAPSAYGPIYDVFAPLLLVYTAWAVVVFVRQAMRFRGLSCTTPCRCGRRRAFARAHGTFAGLTLLLLVLAVVNLLAANDQIPFRLFQYIVLAGSLAFSFGLVVAYLNYASERTTVQAKLVGLGLATVLLVLGAAGLQLLVPTELAAEAGNTLQPRQALRFAPDSVGGYTVAPVEARLRSAEGPLLPETGSAVRLPFAFPFAGSSYEVIHLSACTVAAFRPFSSGPEGRLPRIAAFLRPCYGGSAAHRRVSADDGAVVLTWFNDEIDGGAGTSQLALFPDGTFEVVYVGPRQAATAGGVGFFPGDDAPRQSFSLTDPRAKAPPGTGLWRGFDDGYRALAHRRTRPLMQLVLVATFAVLLFFPLFLRVGLLHPLAALTAGVRRLDAGELAVRVPPRADDELDELARSFNRMAASVRAAQDALRAYADTLEARVTERTAELEEKRRALEVSLDDLRAAQDRLVQQEKLASLGRLTAGVAHEIKNPLNFVNNFAGLQVEITDELAHLLGPLDPAATELLADLRLNAEKIREHGTRADTIVRTMQLHARATTFDRQTTDLAPLLAVAADAAERGFRSRRPGASVPAVVRALAPDLGCAPVAPEALVQVVVNLLDNALDAVFRSNPAGGDGAPGAVPPVVLRAHREDERVIIEVEDQGPGMDDETRQQAFEPFFTTKPPGEGIGLGLSLAYDIVTEGHGGTLEATSTPGNGSTFTVTLPGS